MIPKWKQKVNRKKSVSEAMNGRVYHDVVTGHKQWVPKADLVQKWRVTSDKDSEASV